MTLHTGSILSLQERARRRIFIADVLRIVTKTYNVSLDELRSAKRGRLFVRAKQAAYFLCCAYTARSYPEIGRRMNKDHTTVIWGRRKVQAGFDKYEPELSKCIAELESQCASPVHTAQGMESQAPSGLSIPNNSRGRT